MTVVTASSSVSPRVSVVIPHYRHGRIIRRQIDSLVRQHLQPAEIVVIDDGSPPDKLAEVREVVASFPSVRLEVTGVNRGAAAACNTGLALTSGEFVCFLASDDAVLPEFLAHTAAALQEHTAAALCFSDPALLDESTGDVREGPLYLADRPRYFAPPEVERILRHHYLSFSTHTALFRREAVVQEQGMAPALGSYADAFLDYVLALRHGVVYLPEVLGHYYEVPTSYQIRERADDAKLRHLVSIMLELIDEPRHADVRPAFRRVGVLPMHDLRVLHQLYSDPRGRAYLTPKAVWRCIAFPAWRHVRPWLPPAVRRTLRRAASTVAVAGR